MAKAVKWAIGSEEPEDLPGFKSNDEIGKPPRGVYNFEITKIQKTLTANKDDRLVVTAVISEKDKDKKKWNGYTIWEGFMFVPQSLPYLKRFLKALGISWAEFASKTMAEEDGTVTKIGKVNLAGKTPVMVKAATKDEVYQGQDRLSITSFIAPPEDADEDEDEEEIDDEEEVEEVETEEEEESEEDEPWTREDLEDTEIFSLKDLKAECARLEIDEDEWKSVRKRSTLVDLILAAQEDEEEEDEEEDEEPEIDLDELSPTELKAKAKELGAGVRDLKKAKTKALLIALVEELMEEEDGDEEDGDEPPF